MEVNPQEEIVTPEAEAEETIQNEQVEPSQEGETETEESVEDNTPDEENVPFNKHPRFQRVIQQKNEYLQKYKETEEELSSTQSKLEEIESRLTQYEQELNKNKPQEIPDWFVRDYGDDQELYNEYKKREKTILEHYKTQLKDSLIEELTPALKERLTTEEQRQEHEIKQATEWLESELQTVGEENGLDLLGKDQEIANELMSIAEEWDFVDLENGVYDFRKAYRFYEKNKRNLSENVEKRKQMADESSAPVQKDTPTVLTPDDIAGSWY